MGGWSLSGIWNLHTGFLLWLDATYNTTGIYLSGQQLWPASSGFPPSGIWLKHE